MSIENSAERTNVQERIAEVMYFLPETASGVETVLVSPVQVNKEKREDLVQYLRELCRLSAGVLAKNDDEYELYKRLTPYVDKLTNDPHYFYTESGAHKDLNTFRPVLSAFYDAMLRHNMRYAARAEVTFYQAKSSKFFTNFTNEVRERWQFISKLVESCSHYSGSGSFPNTHILFRYPKLLERLREKAVQLAGDNVADRELQIKNFIILKKQEPILQADFFQTDEIKRLIDQANATDKATKQQIPSAGKGLFDVVNKMKSNR